MSYHVRIEKDIPNLCIQKESMYRDFVPWDCFVQTHGYEVILCDVSETLADKGTEKIAANRGRPMKR